MNNDGAVRVKNRQAASVTNRTAKVTVPDAPWEMGPMTEYKENLKMLNEAAYQAVRTCVHKHPHKELAGLIRIARIIDDLIDNMDTIK